LPIQASSTPSSLFHLHQESRGWFASAGLPGANQPPDSWWTWESDDGVLEAWIGKPEHNDPRTQPPGMHHNLVVRNRHSGEHVRNYHIQYQQHEVNGKPSHVWTLAQPGNQHSPDGHISAAQGTREAAENVAPELAAEVEDNLIEEFGDRANGIAAALLDDGGNDTDDVDDLTGAMDNVARATPTESSQKHLNQPTIIEVAQPEGWVEGTSVGGKATWTVMVRRADHSSRTIRFEFGDGTSDSKTVYSGTGVTWVQFQHYFPIASDLPFRQLYVKTYVQTATIVETGASSHSVTVHTC
jgi:hypothetical protein